MEGRGRRGRRKEEDAERVLIKYLEEEEWGDNYKTKNYSNKTTIDFQD